jgi:formylglycine-generating enzyme required for sulfatase activity
MDNNPSRFKGERRPVEQVSWHDVQKFLNRLNQLTEKQFRLPTEAEWEYAARGGMHSQGYKYAGSDWAKQVAWHDPNSDDETHDAGLLLPNELGLCDMSGNVWEWCADLYDNGYYAVSPKDNPQGPESGCSRVIRGGGWDDSPRFVRTAIRIRSTPDDRNGNLGFRLILPVQQGR